MPTAMMLASRLRLKPRSPATGRKKGPMPSRMPTEMSVSSAAAATMFQPKYHRPSAGAVSCTGSAAHDHGAGQARARIAGGLGGVVVRIAVDDQPLADDV